VVTDKLIKYRENFGTFLVILSFYLFRTYRYLFPNNYQQDDVAELEVTFFDSLFCAINELGDNHPFLSISIWLSSKLFARPEYIVSASIIIIAILSFQLIFNTIKEQYSLNVAIIILLITLFSPAIINYSISLKQYSFELLMSSYSIRFFQKYSNNQDRKLLIKYILISSFLVLFSFVNLVPFVLTLSFILFMNKSFDLKYLLIPLFLVSPFYSNIINKLERVMFGNYWDPFFISIGPNSIQDYIQNFYFLNSMFIKSLFIENLLIIGLVLYLFSILITYFSREPILVYSLLALVVLNLSSFFKIYPLGAGRTDIVFLPFLIVLISTIFNYIFLRASNNLEKYIIVIFLLSYSFNGFLNQEVYYKNEDVTPIIQDIERAFNSKTKEIIVTSEQMPSIMYYSRNLVDSITVEDENSCKKKMPNIKNITLFWKERFYSNYFLDEQKVDPAFFSNKEEIVIIGIELEGTRGMYRDVEDIFLNYNFKIKTIDKYKNGLVSLSLNNQ